jgi:hypothetical protein
VEKRGRSQRRGRCPTSGPLEHGTRFRSGSTVACWHSPIELKGAGAVLRGEWSGRAAVPRLTPLRAAPWRIPRHGLPRRRQPDRACPLRRSTLRRRASAHATDGGAPDAPALIDRTSRRRSRRLCGTHPPTEPSVGARPVDRLRGPADDPVPPPWPADLFHGCPAADVGVLAVHDCGDRLVHRHAAGGDPAPTAPPGRRGTSPPRGRGATDRPFVLAASAHLSKGEATWCP